MAMSRQKLILIAAVCVAVAVATSARGQATASSVAPANGSLAIVPGPTDAAGAIHLVGKHARQQLAVTAQLTPEQVRDVTRGVTYTAEPSNVVQVDANGMVVPLADGAAAVTAKAADGSKASVKFVVERFNETIPVNFVNEVVPVFTKAGCNGGGCHGKSGGQNGFRLSLLGFEPTEDYTHLVHEARARRLTSRRRPRAFFSQRPRTRLPTAAVAGSTRRPMIIKTVVRWIAQGMPYGKRLRPEGRADRSLPERSHAADGRRAAARRHGPLHRRLHGRRHARRRVRNQRKGTRHVDAVGWLQRDAQAGHR